MKKIAKVRRQVKSPIGFSWHFVYVRAKSRSAMEVRFEIREWTRPFCETVTVHDILVPFSTLCDFDSFREAVFARHGIQLTLPKWVRKKPWKTAVTGLIQKGPL